MATASLLPSSHPPRDPAFAALLSIVPGWGQIYNGETRKGLLFLAVTAINVMLLCVLIVTDPILKTLWDFGVANHMKPNVILVTTIQGAHMGSPVSLLILVLMFTFIAYAMRDAYDHASLVQRRHIYPEYVVEISEAASGSYIFHVSIFICCFILAFFFLVPPPPKTQVTDIEFIENQIPTVKKITAPRHAQHASENAGKHENKPIVAPSPAPKAPSHSAVHSPTPSPAHPQPQPHPTPTPHPTPSPMAHPSPTPTPRPAAHPSPAPSLRPTPMPTAHPSPSPSPMPTARPSFMPSPVPSPMATHTSGVPNPMPSIHSSSSFPGNPSPSPSPVAIGRAGGSSYAPMPRSGGSSSNYSGPAAPSPISVGSGSGQSGSPRPVPVVGGGGGATHRGGGQGPSGAPAPSKVSNSRGGGAGGGGPAIAVAPSVARPSGGGGGEGIQGNPGENNNPNGRPSVAAQADVDFGPYMNDLQRRIKRAWFPPKGNESKRVVVVFKIHRGGELSHLRLDRSSGVAVADQAALKAVENAAPFRPLPAGAPDDVDIQFTFDYNVFAGGGHGTFRQF